MQRKTAEHFFFFFFRRPPAPGCVDFTSFTDSQFATQEATPHSNISPIVAGGHRASALHPMAAHLKQIRLIAELLHYPGPGDIAIKAL